ncbi:MAG: pseudouridylate synthase [Chromatiaceae bacterium]|nr:pseudouridylate synthase [Gammaproteobacteria bacterium]MCP5301456.1 pseudouridylate synthase [Chromatiaceae bacterium]MCP5423020.1 pseudouridylate synthase [Chromatiaceae bacterium]
MPLDILFHDPHYVAVDKPAGLLVHRSAISRDRVFALQLLRDQLGRRVYPVHRLDRATSGVLLFALDPLAARLMVAQFEGRLVGKEYLAVARGWPDPEGVIDHPVADDDGSGAAQPATTRYRRLAKVELPYAVDRYPSARYSLLSVTPLSGRRQQIRKHFKHVSHHLIGDTTHGNGRHNRFFRERFGVHRLLLMAHRIAFRHPFDGRRVVIEAQPDDVWERIGRLFGHALYGAPSAQRVAGTVHERRPP